MLSFIEGIMIRIVVPPIRALLNQTDFRPYCVLLAGRPLTACHLLGFVPAVRSVQPVELSVRRRVYGRLLSADRPDQQLRQLRAQL